MPDHVHVHPSTRIVAVALITVMLASCGVSPRSGDAGLRSGGGAITVPDESTQPPDSKPTLRPGVDLEVIGKIDGPLNLIATTAIADLEDWWAEQFPLVFGDEYIPLTGGLYAYDSGTADGAVPCLPGSIAEYLYNAFYCPQADIVAWDQEYLFPEFAADHGNFSIAVILAHEWGHVIQAENRGNLTEVGLVEDIQADCYAGAWARHARDTDEPYFEVGPAELDGALAGLLSLRDLPGSTPDDMGAHGSGFDRVTAFQDGYQNGVASCASYTNASIEPYQFPFLDEADARSDGDMPLEEIKEAAFESLEAYWSDVFPDLADGDDWPGLTANEFSEGDPVPCGDDDVDGYRLFLCWTDRYVGYSSEAMESAYETGIGGDFAVAALLATQYGLGVQVALDHDVTDDLVLATLRGDCLAGAWGADLIATGSRDVPDEWVLRLSPGDLDEGISVLLSFRTDADRERQGPGFDRVTAFRTGVLDGPEACLTFTAER